MDESFLDVGLDNGEGDGAYKESDFYGSKPEITTLDILMCLNERLVGVLALICNSFIIAVFCRVLGLTRLTSYLFVSVAASNIVIGCGIIIHSLAVTDGRLSDSQGKCRCLYLIHTTSSNLVWSCLACAIAERNITTNMSNHYLTTMDIITPTLIYLPWIYWVYRVVISLIFTYFVFSYDMGYSCKHHLMDTIPDDPLQAIPYFWELGTFVLTFVLVVSSTLHPPHYDDMWEANRLRLEYKTTVIWLQVLIPTYMLTTPLTVVSILIEYWDNVYFLLLVKHICYQITIYKTLLLFVVLLSRKEFRRAFKYIFAKKETIRHSRQPNFLVVAAETTRRRKSIPLTQDSSSDFKVPTRVAARDDYKSLLGDTEEPLFQIRLAQDAAVASSWFFQSDTY